jgi:hypothetical protein
MLTTEEKLALCIEALEFYANAKTYAGMHFTSLMPPSPFAKDFSLSHGDWGFKGSAMPGKKAREILTKVEELGEPRD